MVEALGAGGAQAGAVTCPLSDWLLEMWAMKPNVHMFQELAEYVVPAPGGPENYKK